MGNGPCKLIILTWFICLTTTIVVKDDIRTCDHVCDRDCNCFNHGNILRFLLRACIPGKVR